MAVNRDNPLDCIEWCFRVTETLRLKGPQHNVLVYIAKRGRCYASVGKMARQTGESESTVRRVLRWLESGGLIECLERSSGRNTSVYQVTLNPVTLTGFDNSQPGHSDRVNPVTVTPQKDYEINKNPTSSLDSSMSASTGGRTDGFVSQEDWERVVDEWQPDTRDPERLAQLAGFKQRVKTMLNTRTLTTLEKAWQTHTRRNT